MTPENLFFLLLGAALASLLRNIWDYYLNSRYVNSDRMGAMINWHLGFVVAWLCFCGSLIVHPAGGWLYGAIALPLAVLATWGFWAPVHCGLKGLRLIERDSP